jgi:hypothetical protein
MDTWMHISTGHWPSTGPSLKESVVENLTQAWLRNQSGKLETGAEVRIASNINNEPSPGYIVHDIL